MSPEDQSDIENDIPTTDLPTSDSNESTVAQQPESEPQPEHNVESDFSADDIAEMMTSPDSDIDDSSFDELHNNQEENTSTDNKFTPAKIAQALGLTIGAILLFAFLYTDLFTTAPASGQQASGQQALKTERVASYQPTNTDFKRKRTLTQINDSEKIIQTIAQMKVDLDNLRKYGQSGDRSQKALRTSQKMIASSLEELHRLTSSRKLSLDDGGFLEPLANGKGYTITSGSGIRNNNNNGTYIAFKSGTILKDKDESSLTFVFTNNVSGKLEISNLYKINPRHGLVEITKDNEKHKIKDLILNENYDNDRIVKFDYENSVIFFNSLGEISATKKFRQKLYTDTKKNTPIKGSERRLSGFETSDYDIYRIFKGTLQKNGKRHSISGFSQDLSIRYVEYKSASETSNKFAEITAGKNVIKRASLEDIENIMFKKTKIDDVVYIAKNGNIYEISAYGERILKGPGKIIGQIIDAEIAKEKIVLSEKSIKTSSLVELIGMKLYGASGTTYDVKRSHVIIVPSNQIKNIEEFLITSKGDLLSNKKAHLDKITHFKSTGKSGGRIITENYIIEIPNENTAIVLTKSTKTTKTYSNPKIIFERDKWVILKSTPDYELDEVNQTINGIRYETKEIVSKFRFRFVDSDGNYILKDDTDPVFNLAEKTILRERISNVEKIEGNAFDYIYRIDSETGLLKSEGMGKLLLKHKQADYTVFRENTQNTSLTEKTMEISNKQILSIDEFILVNKHLKNVYFLTLSGDTIKILSGSSILFNDRPVTISSGKYNSKLSIFIFELDENFSAKERTAIFKNANIKRFEKTVDKILLNSKNYYTDDIMVIEQRNNKLIKLTSDDGLTIWTSVYSETVDLNENEVELYIKPYYQTAKPALKISFEITDLKPMSKAMSKDIVKQYKQYMATPTKEKAISKTLKKEITNTRELNGVLAELNAKINNIAGTNISITKLTMNMAEIQNAENEKELSGQFNFEIGQELSFNIEKSVEIAEGDTKFIYTDLSQTHYEDREGNSLSMTSPVLVIEVSGDFNTNQIIFTPAKIVFTDLDEKRQTITLPGGSTTLEYTEKESEYVLSGVPAYYINQKVKELPTTVMLTAVQGVIESMASPDEGLAGLAGLGGLTGDDTETSASDSFTDGIAAGTSDGLTEIIEIYKQKAEGKQDILITSGNLELKSIFVKTTPANLE